MTDTHRPVRAKSTPSTGPDVLEACARAAAMVPGGVLGVASLGPDRTRWWTKAGHDHPSAKGPVATQLLPTLLARISGPVVAVDLADHAAAAGLSTWDLEGLASAVIVPVIDPQGRRVGLVAVFDRVVRSWGEEDVRHVVSLAGLLSSQARGLERIGAAKDVALAATELEQCVTGGRFHALVDAAADAVDPDLQRRAGEARSMLDRVGGLAVRLRSAVRTGGLLDVGAGLFDLAAVVAHATGDAARVHGVATPRIQGIDTPLSVAGDPRRALDAVHRAVSAALAAVPPEDVSIVTGTRGAHLASLAGSVVAEVTIEVRGASLGVAELSRVAAARVGAEQQRGDDRRTLGVSLSVTGADIRIVGPGMHAMAEPGGTRIVLSWPVDFG